MSTLQGKFQRKKDVVFEEVEGKIHILDEQKDAIITLNDTASFLWKQLNTPHSVQELAIVLTEEFDADIKAVLPDVQSLLTQLKQKKLITTAAT